MTEENGAILPDEDTFEQYSLRTDARDVEMPEIPQAPKSLTEAMDDATDMTDMQYAAARAFPSTIDFNSVMVARVDPAVFLALLHLWSVNDIMRSDPTADINVNSIYGNNYIRLSVGLDGLGRVDLLELAGASRAEKAKQEGLGKLMGGAF